MSNKPPGKILQKFIDDFQVDAIQVNPSLFEQQLQKLKAFEKQYIMGQVFVFGIDYSTMKYWYISDTIYEVLFLTEANIGSRNITDIMSVFHPAYLDKFVNEVYPLMFGFLKNNILPELRNEYDIRNYRVTYNVKMKMKNGSYKDYVEQATVLAINENKEILMDLGVVWENNFYAPENKIILSIDKLSDEKGNTENLLRKEFTIGDENPIFSVRENEILKLLMDGLSSKQMAVHLDISENTVKNHRRNIFKKASVKKVTELISWINKNEKAINIAS